jgi:arabinofuranan 3-O-arabinosyltransferase
VSSRVQVPAANPPRPASGAARAQSRPGQRRSIPLALAAGAFVLAFVQRPGWATSDTKINLHLAPGRFLSDVASMWTSTGGLGQVHSGQYSGYLVPMGPFFAAGHALGLGAWVTQRLWLGTLLALTAWGFVRLLDALLDAPRGAAHLAAGAISVLNPLVVVQGNRSTVTLLAYVALPWLLLAVHRGVSDAGSWRWPAAFALLVTLTGGGVNAAVTAWALLAPAMLLLYETAVLGLGWRGAGRFAVRTVALSLLVSLWWLVPLYVQSAYGVDFLRFTEQPGSVWATTSMTESLRLMGFWLSYVGIGFRSGPIPYFDDSHTMLFAAPVVVATLLLPALALGGFAVTRRWRYGPFFVLLGLIGVLVMVAGFPEGTLLRRGITYVYYRVSAVQFLRASYKAAPLLAAALACLGGVTGAALWRRAGAARWAVAVAGLALLSLAAWPLVTGRAQDHQVSWKRIPSAWRAAARDLDRTLPPNSRALVLPGELFSFYRWGGTVDPLLPALSDRPVAVRSIVPYEGLRASDLLFTVDDLVHQRRLVSGELPPLLGLMGVRAVVTPTDQDLARSDAPAPAAVAGQLATQPGLAHATRTFGPRRRFGPAPGDLGPGVVLPELRRYALPSARGLVRVEPRAGGAILDGSAPGLAELAAFGALPRGQAIRYAADLSPAELRAAARAGADFVVSDSNRRHAFNSSRIEQDTGPTLAPDDDVPITGLTLDPFPAGGTAAQTVASYRGVRALRAPSSPLRPQFPEHRPYAALDGSPATAWLADPQLDPGRWWLEADFVRPRNVPFVDLLPYDDAGGTVRGVDVAGRSFHIHSGWNRLRLGLRRAGSLRVTLTDVRRSSHGPAGAGGIRELRVPGLRVREALRLPVVATRALRARAAVHVGLTYLLQRTTGDDPFQRDAVHGPWSALRVGDAGDAEAQLERQFELPAARTFAVDAWVGTAAGAPDDALDAIAGTAGPLHARSSSRFHSRPGFRASRALDGDPRTAWIGGYVPGQEAWLSWSAPHPMHLRRLRLLAPRQPVRRPTRVRLGWPGGSTRALTVAPNGSLDLGRVVRTRRVALEVLAAALPAGTSRAARSMRAVGIAEIEGIGGLPRAPAPARSRVRTACGAVRIRVGHASLGLRVQGSAASFAAGVPLRAQGCGRLRLRTGREQLATASSVFAVDYLRLRSPAAHAASALPAGHVLAPGHAGRGSYGGVRVDVRRPAWLVLGESFDRGWRAWCDGRSLGAPRPIDGYANGWPVAPGCRSVRFAFAPNRLALWGYGVSGVAAAACLALLFFRRRRPAARRSWPAWPGDEAARWPGGRALAAGVLAMFALAFIAGLRAGVVLGPFIAVLLWRGVGARALSLAAGALLGIVVPALYLLRPADSLGGNHASYASQQMSAHWVGVLAVVLVGLAAVRTTAAWARAARREPQPTAGPPVDELPR